MGSFLLRSLSLFTYLHYFGVKVKKKGVSHIAHSVKKEGSLQTANALCVVECSKESS